MAVNNSDKKALADAILPEVMFNVTSTHVTILSARFNTPRIVQFDLPGKCRGCKSSELRLDHIITKDGIYMYSNRIKVGIGSLMIRILKFN
jgi:Fe-S cluster biogenesis protein NfuA